MSKNNKNDVVVVNKTAQETTQNKEEDEFGTIDGYLEAPDFRSLERLFEESFLVPGVLDKIGSSVGGNFVTDNKDLKKLLSKIDHDFLNQAREFFGVAYFEVIRNKKEEVSRLDEVITSTVRKLKYGGYVQVVGQKKIYFNDFIADETERKKQIKVWETTGVPSKELATDKDPGFNNNINEIYAFKNPSIVSKNYGHTKFLSSIDQVLLLSAIDTYFLRIFGNSWMNNGIVSPKDGKFKLSKSGKKVLQQFLKDNFNGAKNAGSHAILDVPVEKTDLSDKIDTKAFNEKTDELLKKVAIGLNIPYEILLSVVGNRNTSSQAIENFNNHKIIPIQNRNLKDFRILFEGVDQIEELEYVIIDTKDQLEEMKVVTGYVKSQTISQEQGRKQAGYDEPGKDDTFYTGKAEKEKEEDKDEDDKTDKESDIEKIDNIFKTIDKDVRESL